MTEKDESGIERMLRYRREGKTEDSYLSERWLNENKNPKCLPCIEMGIRYCRFWLNDFNCEKFEGDRMTELLRNIFGKKQKRKQKI